MVKFFKRDWTDGEKWIMGILSGLVLAMLIGIPAYLNTYVRNPEASEPAAEENTPVKKSALATAPENRKANLDPAHYETFTEGEIRGLVYSRVARVLKIPVENVDPNMSIIDGKNIDSLHLVEMVIAIEDATRCQITDDVAEQMVTVEDIIKSAYDSCKRVE